MSLKTYTTIQGDKWDSIAYRLYGSTNYTDKLINANTQYHDIYIFPDGVVLDIPDIEITTVDDLPPWKRVRG